MINRVKEVKKGFTLVETVVAIFLLATAITGPLTIVSRGLLASVVARDQTTAYYLAQDAMEYVRFARDTNKLKGGDWLTGVGGASGVVDLTPCTDSKGCYFDSTNTTPLVPTICQLGGCAQVSPPTAFPNSRFICYQQSINRFIYTVQANCTGVAGVAKTLFARQVAITQPPLTTPADERIVKVTVSWVDTGSTIHSVSVQENMFNWQ